MKATLKFMIFDPFTDSPFVMRSTIIDVQAAPLPAGAPLAPVPEDARRSTGPLRTYTFDTGSAGVLVSASIRVSVPDALKPAATTAFEIEQDFIVTDDGTTVAMTPERSNSVKADGRARAVHPRITFGPGVPNQLPQVNVDLTFVDLTAALRAKAKAKVSGGEPDPFKEYDRDMGKLEPNPSDIHYGCEPPHSRADAWQA